VRGFVGHGDGDCLLTIRRRILSTLALSTRKIGMVNVVSLPNTGGFAITPPTIRP
jgi:hypothetical protein